MEFRQTLSENDTRMNNIYDMIAFCYDYLIETIKDQEQFIGMYAVENEGAERANPNLAQLKRHSRKLELIMRKQEEDGLVFVDCLKQLQKYLDKIDLYEYGDPDLNDATIPYFFLLTADRYVLGKGGRNSMKAPLNTTYCEKSYIYLNIEQPILKEAMEENEFSDVIRAGTIRNQLEHLTILERREMPCEIYPPKVVSLYLDKEKADGIFSSKKIKIAIIPFSEAKMVNFPVDCGALFHVEYCREHLITGKERAVRLLDDAIKHKANIIIFPEFICSREIQESIRARLEFLYEKKPACLKSLLFVVAGSGWTADNNNVAVMYSYTGRLLGKQYKFSRYCDLKHEGKELIENLTKPGKETTIIEIKGLGKVAVGICRDVSDGSYTSLLTEIFAPQLLVTPAWSRSINIGFKEQFRDIITKNHITCCLLCNCCEAIRSKGEFRKNNGIVTTPYKDGSVITGKASEILRTEKCLEKCEVSGCVIMVNIDFNVQAVKKGKIVKKIMCNYLS